MNPDLVVRDREDKPYSVRYDAVKAMLLNEFLKEHRKVRELQSTVAQLKEQDSKIQKMSNRIEMTGPTSQVVATR